MHASLVLGERRSHWMSGRDEKCWETALQVGGREACYKQMYIITRFMVVLTGLSPAQIYVSIPLHSCRFLPILALCDGRPGGQPLLKIRKVFCSFGDVYAVC